MSGRLDSNSSACDRQPPSDRVYPSQHSGAEAYLPRDHPDSTDYEEAVPELAHADRHNISAANRPVELLAGFAELDFRCKAADRLLEMFVLENEAGHQQMMLDTRKKDNLIQCLGAGPTAVTWRAKT